MANVIMCDGEGCGEPIGRPEDQPERVEVVTTLFKRQPTMGTEGTDAEVPGPTMPQGSTTQHYHIGHEPGAVKA